MSYFPFRPIKGVAFRLYFDFNDAENTPSLDSAYSYAGISKDGGTFTETSNAVVEISSDSSDAIATRGRFYIDLTSTEMDANVVCLAFRDSSTGASTIAQRIIYTAPTELSAAPTKSSGVDEKLTALYEYFFNKRTVTATAETLYKDDGSTTLASNTLSDNGTTVSKGAMS